MSFQVIPTWTVVPCPGSRVSELVTMKNSLMLASDRFVVVTTDGDPVEEDERYLPIVLTLPWTGHHISKWWNVGLEYVAARMGPRAPYNVFMPGSDVTGSIAGVIALAIALRSTGTAMVGPDWNGTLGAGETIRTWVGPDAPRSQFERVPGECFMIRGELGMRCDDRFRWWYTDDDLEMVARNRGGAAIVAGVDLVHPLGNELNETQQRHAAEDRALFVKKWGREPW
jgi:hypothetical protein